MGLLLFRSWIQANLRPTSTPETFCSSYPLILYFAFYWSCVADFLVNATVRPSLNPMLELSWGSSSEVSRVGLLPLLSLCIVFIIQFQLVVDSLPESRPSFGVDFHDLCNCPWGNLFVDSILFFPVFSGLVVTANFSSDDLLGCYLSIRYY